MNHSEVFRPEAGRPAGDPALRADRYVLRNALVMTMDDDLGDFERADVLVEGQTIAAVGTDLAVDSVSYDCQNRIVLPGFVNSHHHMFQTALRGYWSDALSEDYFRQSRRGERALFHIYTPEDVYWGEHAGALEQLSAGTTTVVDTSQCTETPEHTDAAIRGIKDSGVRAVYAYCAKANGSTPHPSYAYPGDATRLREEFFASEDQLVTLALGSPVDESTWRLAKDLGLPLYTHINDRAAGLELERLTAKGLGGQRSTYIHCTGLAESTWEVIARSGARVSLSTYVEQTLSTGASGLQHSLWHGLEPSLSTDAVSLGPTDFFSTMRATFALQRSRLQERALAGEGVGDPAIDTREILRMATIYGARAAHLEHRIGSLTPGKQADIIVLDANTLNASPVHHATGTVVMLMDTSNVEMVIVGGRIRKSGGRLLDADVDAVTAALRQSGQGLLARSGTPQILFGSCRQG